ncbi:MAG: PBP1A family penicillin-binding protein [Pseudomonadota bacterium]
MNDWFFNQGSRRKLRDWLGLDRLLSTDQDLAVERVRDGYNAASSWFARMRLTGTRRALCEIGSEGFTLGMAGFVVMYMLALPAFEEADEAKWLTTGQYSVTFLDRNGTEIGRRGINIDDAIPLEDVPDNVIKATLATEDRRFFEHFGVDFMGTLRALISNVRANDVVQGGSTLTQQLAKNLFLSSERSITRKIKEAFLAVWLEARLTKREILKLYLDRAYMGGGAFGVEAAAQFYFGKSVREVTLAEAAMMAGLYKAPTKYAPHINLPAARARANEVLSNLVEAGYYTSGQVYAARLKPAKAIERVENRSPDWFLDWAFEEVQRLMRGRGTYVLTARTTVDLDMQFAAEQVMETTVRSYGRGNNFRSGALVSMEPGGAVRALVGGIDYGDNQFNRATRARRQPGSSFKTYVYAAALANGYRMNQSLRDSTVRCGRWSPKNYNGSSGSGRRVSMTDAFRRSLNTTAVRLSLAVKRRTVVDLTRKLGIRGVRPSCSMALGDTGITPLEHVGGYATFANGGQKATPFGITEISDSKGLIVWSHDKDGPKPEQVVPRRVARDVNRLMHSVVEAGTGQRAKLEFTHAVGKTGTSSSYRDAWFVGFTGKYVTGVWLGNDNYRPMYRRRGGVTGGSFPAQAWQSFNALAHKSMNIPTVIGLADHPTQIAERARLAELRASDPTLGGPAAARGRRDEMPKETKQALEALSENLGRAQAGEAIIAPTGGRASSEPATGQSARPSRS